MKLLLTDANSPLGAAIAHELETETYSLLMPQTDEVNWCDRESVLTYLREQQPDILINTLGWSESSGADNRYLRVEAAKNLALGCKVAQTIPIHLSSYRVFGGVAKSSYDEADQQAPLSEEGSAYALAERHFHQTLSHWICLRLSWLIGAQGDNLLSHLLSGLSAGKSIPVCAEMRGSPTAMSDVARVVIALVKQILSGAENWGYFHYCSSDACTQADFAQQVAAILEQEELLRGSLVVEDTLLSPTEPGSAVLSSRRCRDNFGVQPRSWRQGLHSTIKMWLRQNNPG